MKVFLACGPSLRRGVSCLHRNMFPSTGVSPWQKGVGVVYSSLAFLPSPSSFLFARVCAVSGLLPLFPGFVWDHKCVTAAGLSCPLHEPEFLHKQLQHFSKCRKQIQSVCGLGIGHKLQCFHWLKFHSQKEGSLATGQQGHYPSR